jgi:MFS family permease
MPDPAPAPHAPADTLRTRTYVGLLAAQFLAAFNDQAIHAAAMFFAINTRTLSEAQAISLIPILFYAPWAVFCTLAGYLSDRFSKRNTLVFWKVAEIAITALALFGFWYGTHAESPKVGVWIVLSTVFLMGTHSAFFVPAKYGVMPEILQPQLLSRGNGLLESLSFLAVILGTVSGGVMSFVYQRREANIGVVLLFLAIVGALASLLIRKMPAANPTLRFPRYLYAPLFRNLKMLLWSRTLAFAVIGIAFFTFIVAFMRATVYMFGESQNPRWDELKTSAVGGTVALGVGLGSPLAGWLSGRKVELGLIPLGALGMIAGCLLAAFSLDYIPGFVLCTGLIGFCTGFYLVPLFTLLQYRAPKSSKGDMIASSNFINVTGAILASVMFALLVGAAKKTDFIPKVAETDRVAEGLLEEQELLRGRVVYAAVGGKSFGRRPNDSDRHLHVVDHLLADRPANIPPEIHIARTVDVDEPVIVSHYKIDGVDHYVIRPDNEPLSAHYDARHLPRLLFIGAGLMTFGVVLMLWSRVRDLPTRSLTLVRSLGRVRYQLEGLANVPGDGPVILWVATPNAQVLPTIVAAVDRHVTVFAPKIADDAVVQQANAVFRRGDIVAIVAEAPGASMLAERLEALKVTVQVEGNRLVFSV